METMIDTRLPVATFDQQQRKSFFTELYKLAFPNVARFVANRGGTLQDAKDIFQDGLVIYYEKEVRGDMPDVMPEAYLLGICKHLWIRKFKSDVRYALFDPFEKNIDIGDEVALPVETEKLLSLLERAGKRCLELLTAFYYHRTPMTEIAKVFGFSGERSATVQKFKCIEKLRDEIKNKSLTYEDFIE
jgi:DNA-directed RNA polymerase specialized sigma24 family protein